MAYSSEEQIDLKKKEIKEIKLNLAKKYEDLAKSIALFVKGKSFPYCQNELSNYEISTYQYEMLLNKKQKLKTKVALIADCESEISTFRDSLKVTKKEKQIEAAKFGAAIYEAYSNKKLNNEIQNKLTDIFDKIDIKMDKYIKRRDNSNIILIVSHYDRIIRSLQAKLPKLFINGANYIIDNNLFEDLNIKNKDKFINQLKNNIDIIEELELKIKACEKKIEEIRTEDILSPSRKIDEMKNELNMAKDTAYEAAILLGKELYNKLPNEITSQAIGKEAITLMDNITLELAKIESLDKDIVKLNNEIYISELSAQIAHERTKIKQLEQEIKNSYSQIDKIELIINKKRDKIIELKKVGTYEESTLDLKPLDDINGTT